MFEASLLKAVSEDFVESVRKGEDARGPGPVRDAADALARSLSEWDADGARLPAAEGVLQAANALLDALYEANEEGLPYPIRDRATEMLTLVDEAAENGFSVKAEPSPKP